MTYSQRAPTPDALESASGVEAAPATQTRPASTVPAGRFEWERVVRDMTLRPASVKLVALLMATYADGDGSRVRPGVTALARQVGADAKTVKRATVTLRQSGLIERTKQGDRWRGQADEYRLTLPDGLVFLPELQSANPSSLGDTSVT